MLITINKNIILLERLDIFLTKKFFQYSRSQIKKFILKGNITVNNVIKKPKYKISYNDIIKFNPEITQLKWIPENIPLNIIFEDNDIIVINKPAGLVMHPGAGNVSLTLANALLYYNFNIFSHLPRAGIVHRLDKDTSGLVVVSKNNIARMSLIEQLSNRTMIKHYEAIVYGSIPFYKKTIINNINRHPINRKKMIVSCQGKEAITHITVLKKYNRYTKINCSIESGRTHQIRVHLQFLKFPIVGDQIYKIKQKENPLKNFKRQALHAVYLKFKHPIKGNDIAFNSKLSKDILKLIDVIVRV